MSANILQLPTAAANSMPEAPSPWWRVERAATYARVHRQQIFKACREHKLEHVRLSGRGVILTTQSWVDSWLTTLIVHVAPTTNRAA